MINKFFILELEKVYIDAALIEVQVPLSLANWPFAIKPNNRTNILWMKATERYVLGRESFEKVFHYYCYKAN